MRDRARIAAKLFRIQEFIANSENIPGKWTAIYEVDRLRRRAIYDPPWRWDGFTSEIAWARALGEIVQ